MRLADFRELERTLARLDGCDLGDWDRTFVDDLAQRCLKADEAETVFDFDLTPRQWEQVDRMKEQYDVDSRP